MPATYWIPFQSVTLPIKTEHLHAVVTSWFDHQDGSHGDTEKPYSLSPATEHEGQVGVQVSVLTNEAETLLREGARPGTPVRFGSMTGQVGDAVRTDTAEWPEFIRTPPAHSWLIEFRSPTCFRTGERIGVLPIPALMLRTPTALWQRFSPVQLEPLTGDDHRSLLVTHARLETLDYRLADVQPSRSQHHRPHEVTGVVGAVLLTAPGDTASKVEPLLRLAEFGGMGAYRGKGMGVVSVVPQE